MKKKKIILTVCLLMTLTVNVMAFAVPFFGTDVDSVCECTGHDGNPHTPWAGDGCCKATAPETGPCEILHGEEGEGKWKCELIPPR
jgi:hypothetical protein